MTRQYKMKLLEFSNNILKVFCKDQKLNNIIDFLSLKVLIMDLY